MTKLGLTDRVSFTGHLARPEELLSQLDVFALSSDTEQMPLSLLEAMAMGLPVVATDVGDVRAMLPEAQQEFVVANADEDGLTAAMAALATDASLRQQLGGLNRNRVVASFGNERMFSRYNDLLFIEMLNGGVITTEAALC